MQPDLHRLMTSFVRLGYVMTGFGPKHPITPDPDLQAEISEFLFNNEFLRQDGGYVDFLEAYSSASVDWPNFGLHILIYGFNPGVNVYLPAPDEPLDYLDDFYRFAELGFDIEDSRLGGISFAWDMTGVRRQGVYRRILVGSVKESTYEWYCPTFLDWLESTVSKKGRLLD